MKHFVKHAPHYLSLIAVITLGLVGFMVFKYDRAVQTAAIVATAVSYVIWGVVHHYIHKNLYLIVIIEYVLVAIVGLIIVFSLVLQT